MDDIQILKNFGNKVRQFREKQHLSQEKLADLANLHRTYIGLIERAEKNPSLITIYKIAKALNVDINDLI